MTDSDSIEPRPSWDGRGSRHEAGDSSDLSDAILDVWRERANKARAAGEQREQELVELQARYDELAAINAELRANVDIYQSDIAARERELDAERLKSMQLAAGLDFRTRERDDARRFGEEAATRYNALLSDSQKYTLTCAFCGHEYPPGTPPTQHEALTAHVHACEKHPLRAELDARERRIAELERLAALGEAAVSRLDAFAASQARRDHLSDKLAIVADDIRRTARILGLLDEKDRAAIAAAKWKPEAAARLMELLLRPTPGDIILDRESK